MLVVWHQASQSTVLLPNLRNNYVYVFEINRTFIACNASTSNGSSLNVCGTKNRSGT